MDPCCRTLEGFLALLEREWVQVSVHNNTGWTACKMTFQQLQSWDVVQVSGSRGGGGVCVCVGQKHKAKFHFLS